MLLVWLAGSLAAYCCSAETEWRDMEEEVGSCNLQRMEGRGGVVWWWGGRAVRYVWRWRMKAMIRNCHLLNFGMFFPRSKNSGNWITMVLHWIEPDAVDPHCLEGPWDKIA